MRGAVLWVLLVALAPGPAAAGERLFATWEGWEADKLASAWLITRFVAPGARVAVHPKGTTITEGVEFDTPNARMGRQFNRSAFEQLLEHYRLADPGLANIGRIIHDIEINTWERKAFRRTQEVEAALGRIVEEGGPPEAILTRAAAYFDGLYRALPGELESLEE